ncbi:hypothetical protein SeMB42_g04828 [Synchytrium endobioticum]|uniref:Uncharacterized protein n=1 Tax=Synchytrium endobioticum TaxID=286115 RepID=A0A507CWE7_9FUNG|nr:hypothetical protein SeMB42_g04828 [Synchytrium endobioticum]
MIGNPRKRQRTDNPSSSSSSSSSSIPVTETHKSYQSPVQVHSDEDQDCLIIDLTTKPTAIGRASLPSSTPVSTPPILNRTFTPWSTKLLLDTNGNGNEATAQAAPLVNNLGTLATTNPVPTRRPLPNKSPRASTYAPASAGAIPAPGAYSQLAPSFALSTNNSTFLNQPNNNIAIVDLENEEYKDLVADPVFPSTVQSIKELLDTVPSDTTEEYAKAVQEKGRKSMTPAGVTCELMEHQVVGLAWLSKMEKEGKGMILADEMGMGKTIQTIALMVQNLPQQDHVPKGTLIVCPQSLLRQWNKEVVRRTKSLSSIIYHGTARHQHVDELEDYDVVITTYGILVQERPADIAPEVDEPAAKHDAVVKRKKRSAKGGPLFRIKWHRIVLDEAQIIRNKSTQQSIAVTQLKAKHRLCLTGTPLQTHLDELFSQFRFLRTPNFQYYTHFAEHITSLEKKNSKLAMARLQAVLRGYMLRRRKDSKNPDGTPILKLPAKKIETHIVQLSPAERRFYNLVERSTQDEFQAMLRAGIVMEQIGHILVMLLRLRLAATHPSLLRNIFHKAREEMEGNVKNNGDDGGETEGRRRARQKMHLGRADTLFVSIDNKKLFEDECPICTEEIAQVKDVACTTFCGHVYCLDCIIGVLNAPRQLNQDNEEADAAPCPICRQIVREPDLIALADLIPASNSDDEVFLNKETLNELDQMLKSMSDVDNYFSSSKVDKMIEILLDARNKAPDDKFIVFSQWTKMLDIVEHSLEVHGFKFCRYDGTMSTNKREQAIEQLQDDPATTIMLVSLKAGGVGLNLTAASRVVNLDLWYNPQLEQQAFGRVHRVGQTRDVHIHRFNVANTIEERIQLLVDQRLEMAKGALGDGIVKLQRLTLQNLMMLFGGGQGGDQGNMDFLEKEERTCGRRHASSSAPSPSPSSSLSLEAITAAPTNPAAFPPVEQVMLAENYHARMHAKESVSFWWRINLYVVAPALVLVAMYSLPGEFAHIRHLQEHPNEFVAYPYLRKRKNPFPFSDGDHTMFSNPMCNPDPAPEE